MQIVCPNCSARYLVDPAAIGQQGRTVQCFRCGHQWMAYAAIEPVEAPAEPVLTDTRPVPDFIIRPQNHDEPVALPAVPPERGMPIWLKLVLGLLILVVLLGGLGYAFRDQLWPESRPVVPPPPPPSTAAKPPAPASGVPALMLENVRLEPVPDGGGAIVASGNIVNTRTVEAVPRRIRFIFKDQDGKAVGERMFELEPDRIAPLTRLPFSRRVDDPPAGAVDVEVVIEAVE